MNETLEQVQGMERPGVKEVDVLLLRLSWTEYPIVLKYSIIDTSRSLSNRTITSFYE